MTRVGLVAACADAALLAFAAHPLQAELLGTIERHRLTVAACGRRSGKTRCAAGAAVHNLLLVPGLDAMVGAKEKRYAISIANSIGQARIFVDHARSLVEASPVLRSELVAVREYELEFTRNRILAAFPCSARSGRGFAASFLLLDEFAHFVDLAEGPAVAGRIYTAMMPSVAQFGDLGRVVIASTPGDSGGLFETLFLRARNGELPGAAAFEGETGAMNPSVSPEFLEAERIALGEDDYRREYLAQFVAGGASFFDADALAEVVEDRKELLPSVGQRWILGLDPSFARDPSAVAVVGRDGHDRDRLVLGHVERWVPQLMKGHRTTRDDVDRTIARILDAVAGIALRFGARVVSDQHLPGVVEAELRERGVGVTIAAWTPSTKTDAFSALRARVHTRRIGLYDDGQLVPELLRLRTKYRAGSAAVETPRVGDSHCDEAVALAAAVYAHDRDGVSRGVEAWPRHEHDPGSVSAGLLAADLGSGRRGTRRPRWYDDTNGPRF